MTYPKVAGEFATVRKLLEGKSIARFGDGELKILGSKGYRREQANNNLTAEMRDLVENPHPNCLIAIPTMDPAGPKYENWMRHVHRFNDFFRDGEGKEFYSAFITRPDSAADTLESTEYVRLISSAWIARGRVVVVCEPDSKLLTAVRMTCDDWKHIECPSHGAYSVIHELEEKIVAETPSIALLSCGPTATCLANRMAKNGIQGLDLGSIGGLLVRWL